MQAGDRVKIEKTGWKGTVTSIAEDGTLTVSLDNGTSFMCPRSFLMPVLEGNATDKRDENGRFLPGHKKLGGAQKSGRSIRQYRKNLLEKLTPFLDNIDVIIEQIDAPEDKILSISRMMKYAMPTLSSVEFKEGATRNLSAEEKIAQLNARYNNLPDPTEALPESEE